MSIAERNLQAHLCSRVLVTPGNVLESPRETSHIITSTPAKFQPDLLSSAWYQLCICMYDMASPYVSQPLSETCKFGSQVAGLCSCALYMMGTQHAKFEAALFWAHTYLIKISGAKVPSLLCSCPNGLAAGNVTGQNISIKMQEIVGEELPRFHTETRPAASTTSRNLPPSRTGALTGGHTCCTVARKIRILISSTSGLART